jgi:hypothetical protein
LTGSNRIPFHDQVNTRVQPECRPALSVRSAGAQTQSFHYTTHNVHSVVATTPLHDTQRTQRCRHHPLDDYNKRFNEQNKKHTFEIDFFSLLLKSSYFIN